MPIWLQLLIPASVMLIALARTNSQTTTGSPQAASVNDAARLWHAFYALQNSLVSLSRAIEAVDTNLGVIVVVSITGFTYFRDKALDAANHAIATGQPVQHYPFVFGWLLLAPIALTVVVIVRLVAEEGPETSAFIVALQSDEVGALRDAIEEMSGIYERNLTLRAKKQRALIIAVLMFVGILMLDAVWPAFWGILEAGFHAVLR